MATTLGEILSAKGDADYSEGGLGGNVNPELYSTAAANQYLQHAADLQYQANRYIAEQHNLNLQNTLKGLQDVDFKDMLPTDRAALMQEYSGVLQNTSTNFGAVRNPLSNPTAWADLKSKESQFRQNLATSQFDAAYLARQQQHAQLHPELNTPAYRQKVAEFLATPVGQRKYFTIEPPTIINWDALGKTAGELSKQKYASAKSDGKYTTKEKGEKYNDETYKKWFSPENLNAVQDSQGRPLYPQLVEQYNSLPENIRNKFPDQNDWIQKMAEFHKPQDQVIESDIDADQYGLVNANYRKQLSLQNDRQAFDANEKELDRNNALVIAGLRQGKVDQKVAAEGVLRTVASVLRTGNVPKDVGQKLFADNTIFEKKMRDPGHPKDDKLVSTAKLPITSYVESGIDENGNIHIYLRDNRTGKMLPNAQVISGSEFLTALNNQYGIHSASIQGEISKFSQKEFGKNTPSVIDLLKHFGLGTDVKPTTRAKPAAGSKYNAPLPDKVNFPDEKTTLPGTIKQISNQTEYDSLPKGAQYMAPDGQTYIKN